jgi:hypothetical protein
MHQTTKSRLFCPYPDCVRAAGGEGFSRKENLEEHKRRRHPGYEPPGVVDDDDDDENYSHGQQSRKRKRFITPQPSTNGSPHEQDVVSPSIAAETTTHDGSSDLADIVDKGPLVKRLRSELAAAQTQIARLSHENDDLRRQFSQYYAYMSQTSLQVYPVGQPQGYLPQQAEYGQAYGGGMMQSAYKK